MQSWSIRKAGFFFAVGGDKRDRPIGNAGSGLRRAWNGEKMVESCRAARAANKKQSIMLGQYIPSALAAKARRSYSAASGRSITPRDYK